MSRRETLKTKDRRLRKIHNEAVNIIAQKPEILEIDRLNSETLLYKPIIFPELKKKGQETGDLIFVWSPWPEEWEILVAEVHAGVRSYPEDFLRSEMSFRYFKNHWREWLQNIGLALPEGYTLWIRTVSLNYIGRAPWEQPFRDEIIRRRVL